MSLDGVSHLTAETLFEEQLRGSRTRFRCTWTGSGGPVTQRRASAVASEPDAHMEAPLSATQAQLGASGRGCLHPGSVDRRPPPFGLRWAGTAAEPRPTLIHLKSG